ncbi:MAG TPA: hypothetical protein VFS36_13820 [Chitinophagaceae bacterium]|jgi:hypothetical protein|nr:hypothetical protein [Chitinophagaceae bacterium]
MKKRIRKVVNFFAFNLLFFALYLNFIHRDKPAESVVSAQHTAAGTAYTGTVLVQNPEKYLQKNVIAADSKATPVSSQKLTAN